MKAVAKLAAWLLVMTSLAPKAAWADTANHCLSQSTGAAGYQFRNKCDIAIRAFMREGGISGATGKGSWRALTLRPGETKVVSGYSGPVVACPLSARGEEVTLDPSSRDCVFKR